MNIFTLLNTKKNLTPNEEQMDLHGIDMKNLCTFGDADNDYDMTLNAGVGVVMANGSKKTKSVAITLQKITTMMVLPLY